jgi:hypothetical protein
MNRKNFIIIYIIILSFISCFIYFGLKNYSQKNFSIDKLQKLINTTSSLKDKTNNLCKYHILSEPKVENQYIKINFWCQDLNKARSTLSLAAIENITIEGILKEYARIINFDYQLINQNQWYCLINDEEITSSNITQKVKPASTIDCFENKNLYRYDQKEL